MSIKNSSAPTKKYRLVFSAVHMVYRLVNSTYNTKELLLRLTRLICQIINASSSDIFLLDNSKKRIASVASFNNKINMFLDRKAEIDILPQDEKDVAWGSSIHKARLIGLPLVADDNIGAIFIRRKIGQPSFSSFEKDVLSVIAEQTVLAIKNLQLYDNQQKIILGSMKSIGNLIKQYRNVRSDHAPAYFQIMKCLAEKLNMSAGQIESLRYASFLHTAGALDVPYEILSKTSRLTSEEFKIIQDFPFKSAELIKPVEFLRPVLPTILYHREKYDGTGYPSGLKKEQIPLGARIMAVVDAIEAIICGRPYKKSLSIAEAAAELKRNSGTQFDPKVIHAFLELYRQKKFRKYLSSLK